ncbi:MAG: hypothetical protein AAB443_01100 [Patescibacteria group bacterium]
MELKEEILKIDPNIQFALKVVKNGELVCYKGEAFTLFYLASISKLCWVITVLNLCREKNLSITEPIVSCYLNKNLFEDIFDYCAKGKPVDKFVERDFYSKHAVILGKLKNISLESLKALKKAVKEENYLYLLDLVELSILNEGKEELKGLIAKKLERGDKTNFGNFSIKELIDVTLGPSSNHSLLNLKDFLKELGYEIPANVVQKRMEEILGTYFSNSKLTITGSDKASKCGYWNCGTFDELFKLFYLLAHKDKSLGLMEEEYKVVIDSMKEVADSNIELKPYLVEKNFTFSDCFGKSGYFPNIDLEDFKSAFVKQKKLGFKHLMSLCCLENILVNEISFDIGYFVTYFHNEENSDNLLSVKKELSEKFRAFSLSELGS